MDFLPDDFAAPTSLVPRVHAVVVEKGGGLAGGLEPLSETASGDPRRSPSLPCPNPLTSHSSAGRRCPGCRVPPASTHLQGVCSPGRDGVGKPLHESDGLSTDRIPGRDAGPPQTSLTGFAVILKEAIQDLCPRCIALPLTTQVLNERRLRPRRDYTRNRLVTGPLQAAPGTPLVLDEIALEAGNLTPLGVDNLQALKGILDSQWVEYDYQYFNLQMPGDMPVIILSASSSLLKPFVDIVPPAGCWAGHDRRRGSGSGQPRGGAGLWSPEGYSGTNAAGRLRARDGGHLLD
eukprot:jgi/Botrbrau1/12245/Bobra.0361s0008.2